MSQGNLLTCSICGRLYEFQGMLVGDQSMCAGYRAEATRAVRAPDTEDQKRRRRS